MEYLWVGRLDRKQWRTIAKQPRQTPIQKGCAHIHALLIFRLVFTLLWVAVRYAPGPVIHFSKNATFTVEMRISCIICQALRHYVITSVFKCSISGRSVEMDKVSKGSQSSEIPRGSQAKFENVNQPSTAPFDGTYQRDTNLDSQHFYFLLVSFTN